MVKLQGIFITFLVLLLPSCSFKWFKVAKDIIQGEVKIAEDVIKDINQEHEHGRDKDKLFVEMPIKNF